MGAKSSGAKRRTTTRTRDLLWLGAFWFQDDEGREGSFSMIVRARGARAALDACKDRLRALRAETTLFERATKIYFDGILELPPDAFGSPVLVNYASRRTGHALELHCDVPEQPDVRVRAYQPQDGTQRPFLRLRARA